jgi:hypothetical protein
MEGGLIFLFIKVLIWRSTSEWEWEWRQPRVYLCCHCEPVQHTHTHTHTHTGGERRRERQKMDESACRWAHGRTWTDDTGARDTLETVTAGFCGLDHLSSSESICLFA